MDGVWHETVNERWVYVSDTNIIFHIALSVKQSFIIRIGIIASMMNI